MEDLRVFSEKNMLGIKIDQMRKQSQGIYASEGMTGKLNPDDYILFNIGNQT